MPRNQRSDRDSLIESSTATSMRSRHDGSVALTHAGCGRVENGSPAPAGAFLPPGAPRGQGPGGGGAAPAGRGAPAGPGGAQPGPGSNDCVGNLQNFNLSMVVARRTPVVDEEAQVVLAYAVFIRRPGSPTPRNVFSEWFNIEEGRSRRSIRRCSTRRQGWPCPTGRRSTATGRCGDDRARTCGAAAEVEPRQALARV